MIESFDSDITVHLRNAKTGSTAGNLVLPYTSLGQRHYLSSWPPVSPLLTGSTMAVVATEDMTRVTIDVPQFGRYETLGTFTLNRYEVWSDAARAFDYTGTRVTADKPVAVFSGHECAQIPDIAEESCDMLAMQVPRVEDLGTEFLVPPAANRGSLAGYFLRVVASENFTQVQIVETRDQVSLEEGEFLTVHRTTDTSTVVTCSRPCLVTQYNTAQSVDNSNSDPAMMPILPFSSFAKEATFGTLQGDGDLTLSNYLTLITSSTATDFELNGNIISPSWTESTLEGWLFANYPIQHGIYRLTNSDPSVKYAAYVQGHGGGAPYTAYAMIAMSGEKEAVPSTTAPPFTSTLIPVTSATQTPVTDVTSTPVTSVTSVTDTTSMSTVISVTDVTSSETPTATMPVTPTATTAAITGSTLSPPPIPTSPPAIPPTFHVLVNSTFHTADSSDITIECSYLYSERLEFTAEQQKRNLQTLIPETLCGNQLRFYCSRQDKIVVVSRSSAFVYITFMFDVDMGRTPLEMHACSVEVADYLSDMNNWPQPLIPTIPGCKGVVWNPNRWDESRRRWNCGAD